MNERKILDWIESLTRSGAAGPVRVGIGDDCAVVRPPAAGSELVVTVDQMIEKRHFMPDRHPPEAVGGKLLARGVSDVAAMGGRPSWMVLTLALPGWAKEPWVKQFLAGMFDKRRRLGLETVVLAGGDLSAADTFSASVTVVGETPARRALLRSGARAGDRLWVSGSLGGAALGLARLLAGSADDDPAVGRHLDPVPPMELGPALLEAGATAAMDLSDGLSIDAERLADASEVGFEIDADAIPVFADASLDQALHGGDDYELLFTTPADFAPPAETGSFALTPIGVAVGERGVRLRTSSGLEKLEPRGFDHFR